MRACRKRVKASSLKKYDAFLQTPNSNILMRTIVGMR